jgi:prepilin-type N-terminal cleavage/methylation domain-containing protein
MIAPRPMSGRLEVVTPLPTRRGFTLVEMVVSTLILAILIAVLGSVATLTARATNNRGLPTTQLAEGAEIIDRISGELRTALSFSERTARAVTFTVPDRNGDGAPETLRYTWSGTPGEPLMRSVNGVPAVVAGRIYNLDFSYIVRTAGPPPPPPTTETPEMVLASHDDFAGAGTMASFGLSSTSWSSQYFKPALPSNALSWKVTRVQVMLKRDTNSTGTMSLRMQYADAAKRPAKGFIQEVTFAAGSMSTVFTWNEASFSSVGGIDPAVGLCLVVGMTGQGGKPPQQQYETALPSQVDRWASSSADGGATWGLPYDTSVIRFYVYGTVTLKPQ